MVNVFNASSDGPAHNEARPGILNETEFLARINRTETAYAQRTTERARAAAWRDNKTPMEAETLVRQTKRYANIGQQPITSGERELAFERILGTNDLVGITFVERMLRAITATGRVVIRTPDGRGGFGTGFLIAPGVLLTNNHVLASESVAALSRVQFDFEERDGGVLVDPIEFRLRPDHFFLTNAALDYTFVGVAETNDGGATLAEFGFVPLIESEGKVSINEPMNIIQHPSGERKRLALRRNLLIDLLPDFLHYEADTSPGSSGSPVFSDQWEVVGLHHSGVPKRSAEGKILTRSDTEWRSEMGEDAIAWMANEGVRVSRIIQTLKTAQLGPAQATVRQAILAAPKLKLDSLLRRRSAEAAVALPGVAPAEAGTWGSPTINADGSATWTLPLTVTLGVGGSRAAATAPSRASVAVATSALPANTMVPSSKTPGTSAGAAVAGEVARALEEFERARSQPYYDEAADRADRQAYYASLGARANRAPRVDDLTNLLSTTHTSPVRYDSGRSIYIWADLHEDTLLRSIYSGVTFNPREALEEVVMLDQQVKAVEARITEGQFTESIGLEQIQLLEAASPFNCEHVVPQSWFGRGEPMRGDMHHLFACGSRCNSFRGNTPYFDFPDFEEAVMSECGKREKDADAASGFEPNRGKAIVARATLYFFVRYPQAVAATSFPAERIPVLLAWHKTEEPSRYERHRNQAIFKRQGNRNPFIDFPKWAEAIDFEALLE